MTPQDILSLSDEVHGVDDVIANHGSYFLWLHDPSTRRPIIPRC